MNGYRVKHNCHVQRYSDFREFSYIEETLNLLVSLPSLSLSLSLSLKIYSINILKICRFNRIFITPGSISNEVYIRDFLLSYNPRVTDAIQLVFTALTNRVIDKSDEIMSF